MALGLLLWMAAFVAVGYVVRLFLVANGAEATTAQDPIAAREPILRSASATRLLQIAPIVILAVLVWTESRNRSSGARHADIAVLWILMMALSIVVAAWPIQRPSLARFLAWARIYKFEIAAVALISLIALGLRVYQLNRFPTIYSGDEGTFALSAVDVLEGRLNDPFATGWFAHPTLWFYLQAGFMRIFNDDVAGSRMVSGVMGAATIPLAYLLVRRHFGILAALTAASLLTFFHFHLYWSRDALNNISTPFFVVLILLLLDRVIDKWRPVDALLAGLAIGLSQYGYVSNRIFVPLAAVYFVFALFLARPTTRAALDREIRRVLTAGVIVAAGFVLAVLPLAAWYIDNRDTFGARQTQVSIFAPGWFDARQAITGDSKTEILWGQFKNAAMLPFNTLPQGNYRFGPPFVGRPFVIPLAIGIVLISIGFWKRKFFGLAAAYWATVVGLAFTIGPPQTNRYVMAASLLPIIAAIGLVLAIQWLCKVSHAQKFVTWAAVAVIIAVIAYWNFDIYFDEHDEVSRSADINTLVATNFAYEMEDLGSGYTVYFAAAPRMYYTSHATVPFIYRNGTGIDVSEPWSASSVKPELTGPTVFFFLPERSAELDIVRGWFPIGERHDVLSDTGVPLYTLYRVLPNESELRG